MKIPLIRTGSEDRLIVTGNQQSVSVAEFLGSAIHLSENFKKADYIVNLCRDRYNFLLVFAAALIGKKTSIHPPNRQTDSLNDILKDYQSNLCISDDPDSLSGLECMNLNEVMALDDVKRKVEYPEIEKDHLAAIAFTSGSTGKPSPNRKTWGIFVGTTERLARRFGFYDSQPILVGTVPSQHMYGLEMTILMALHGNCTLHDHIPFFPKDVGTTLDSIESAKVLVTTPVHLRALVESGIELSPLQLIVSATAPLSTPLAEKAEELGGCHLEEIYGCTEGGSIATRHTVKEPIWKLLDDMKIRSGREDESILVAEHLPDEVILQDQLILHSEEEFEFLGRNQDMLNVGGKRYSVADLVLRLLEIEGVKDAFVFVPDEGEKVSRPFALVVSDITEKQIVRILSEKIDPVFIPRPFKLVDHIPRNETGKVGREQLQKLLKVGQSG